MAESERFMEEDHFADVRERAEQRLKQKFVGRIKSDISELPPESNSPYTIANVLWLTAALVVFRLGEVAETVLYDRMVNRFYFNIGCVLILVNVCICLFCVVWLSYVKQIHSDEWEKLYPAAIPVATASFVFGGVFVCIGLWPVWGYLTPVILFILFMGFIVLVAMIPARGAEEESRDIKSRGEHVD